MASNVSYISTYVQDTSSITLAELETSAVVGIAEYILNEIKKTNIHLASLTEEEVLDEDAT